MSDALENSRFALPYSADGYMAEAAALRQPTAIAQEAARVHLLDAWVYPLVGGVAVGLIQLLTLLRVAFRSGPVAMFCDDFFYYAVAARSYLRLGFTTFDGQTNTNGYHPAWLVLVVQIMRFSGAHFLYAVAVVVCVLVAVSTFLVARLLRLCGVASGVSVFCSILTVGCLLQVLGGGMESGLVAPALLVFSLYAQSSSLHKANQWVVLGLLSAFAILSRLDAVIFVILYITFAAFFERRSGRFFSKLVAFAVGALPAALYFLYNRVVFGAFMTVSSKAKELRTTHMPSLLPVHGIMHPVIAVLYLTSLIGILKYLYLGAGTVRRPLALAALLFPFAQLGALCFVSEWPLEPWYPYGLVVSFPLAVCILLQPVAKSSQRRVVIPALVGLAAGIVLAIGLQVTRVWSIRHDSIGSAAEQIAAWSKGHPGRLAMGDRAGKVGWLLDEGPLQLEGLMADLPYLEHLRRQDDLESTLRTYHIRYYVATDLTRHDGCYEALEPMRSGPTSLKMHSEFCSQPLFVYADTAKPGEIPDAAGPGVVTMIFDVDQRPGF